MVTYIFVWMTCGRARLKNVEMATSHVLLVREKRETKSQRQGYPSVNQHSQNAISKMERVGYVMFVPWRLLNTFDVSFAAFIQTETFMGFLKRHIWTITKVI